MYKVRCYFIFFFGLIHLNSLAGSSQGFKIIRVEPGSVYENMGLRTGDLMKSINGTALDSMAKFQHILDDTKFKTLKLKIERDGKEQEITYNIK